MIISSSIIPAIKHISSDANEPLYGSAGPLPKIKPFSCLTIRHYLEEENPIFSAEDLLMFYAMTDAVPRFMELLASFPFPDSNGFKNLLFSQARSWYRQDGPVILENELRPGVNPKLKIQHKGI